MELLFADRRQAGRVLGEALGNYMGREDVVVLALPRGGVPVAFEVARRIGAPLDVFLVRKLGVPGHEELAMGAIAAGGSMVINDSVVRNLGVPRAMIEEVTRRERAELERRDRLYRGERPLPDVRGKTVIVVDDGLATGATMRAAAMALRAMGPARIVIAAPIGSDTACEEAQEVADEVVCAATPRPFYGVGQWYEVFDQTTDDEVRELLDLSRNNVHS